MKNTLIVFCIIFIAIIGIDYYKMCQRYDDSETRYDRLLEQAELLRIDSQENAKYQDSTVGVIDSLVLIKKKKSIVYEKDIDTIYAISGDLLDSLLSKAYDSLYIYRFSKLVKKKDSHGGSINDVKQ